MPVLLLPVINEKS